MPWNHKIHSRIVNNDSDLEGIVAYHLYKNEKRDWIETKRQKLGKAPTSLDIDSNYHNQITDVKIDTFRSQARQIVSQYREVVIAESLRIQSDAVLEQISTATDKSLKGYKISPTVTFFTGLKSFGLNVFAGVCATALVVFIYTMFWLNEARATGQNAKEVLCEQSEQAIQARKLIGFNCDEFNKPTTLESD